MNKQSLARRGLGAITSSLVVVLLAGCGSGDDGSAPSKGTTRAAADTIALDGTASDRAFLKSAENIIVAKCMQAKGFRYIPLKVTADQIESAGDDNAAKMDDLERARREGFGFYKEKSGDHPIPDPNRSHLQSLSAAKQQQWDEAMGGGGPTDVKVEVPGVGTMQTSSKGCNADAQRQLYGDFAKWKSAETPVRNRFGQINAWLRADRTYTATIPAWRSCMQGKGYRYADPEAAVSDAARRFIGRPELKAQEIKVAAAHAECDRQARVGATIRELTVKYTQRWVAENEGKVAEVQAMRKVALAKAKKLVG